MQVDEVALQYGSVREMELGARFQTAVNWSIGINWNFVLRSSSCCEQEYKCSDWSERWSPTDTCWQEI